MPNQQGPSSAKLAYGTGLVDGRDARSAESPAVRGQTIEHIDCRLDLTYNWGYQKTREDLRDLYRKAKLGQWNSDETLPWSTDVDLTQPGMPDELFPLHGSELLGRLTAKERETLNLEFSAWVLSQFMHGEQGALLAAAQLTTTVPDIESKYYAATQVMDEARHVEVYDRYLHDKIGFSYPINVHLKKLLDLILTDSRWDMKLLGMQIMVEGLALASFAMLREYTSEPLLKAITTYVMRDEARHVAYGILSLRGFYDDLKESERHEREDFIYEAAVLMRDRFLFEQVWEKMGMPVEECVRLTRESHVQQLFRQMLFSRIVPALKKMDLLTPTLRERFESLGILQFEHSEDPFAVLAQEEAAAAAERQRAAGATAGDRVAA